MKTLVTLIFFAISAFADPTQDLYEEIISASLRTSFPAESDKSFKVHLLDSYKFFPSLKKISNTQFYPLSASNIYSGTMVYASVVKKKYRYEVFNRNSDLVFNVRVFLKNATPQENLYFKKKLLLASGIWNKYRPSFDFNYKFQFETVADSSRAHYKVELKDDTRGPYDTYWDRHWDEKTLAHEIGHMLGLGDEYQTVSSKMDCLMVSLMCSSTQGAPMLHHYYFILRRFIQNGP